ncbi:MAG: F0F1 ATP synthase subunit A [Anaerolineae bacterium]|nr:F0F1 ATP synthase subunit A [Anaerolineae bacterium]
MGGITDVFPKTEFLILGLPVRDSIIHSWIITVILLASAAWARERLRTWEPRPWQLAIEYFYDYVRKLTQDYGARALPDVIPLIGTMLAYIAIANLLGLLPLLQAPTRDINVTAALSIISLGAVWYFGIKERGAVIYLRQFLNPLNLVSEISRALSMALRLFGNIMAGELIVATVFLLVPPVAPILFNALTMITSVIQALVFAILTLAFIVNASGVQTRS